MGLGLLVVVAGVGYRFRIRGELERGSGSLSDDKIRRIVERGSVELDDDPLDMEEIERAEEEFWEERWDEPEPW